MPSQNCRWKHVEMLIVEHCWLPRLHQFPVRHVLTGAFAGLAEGAGLRWSSSAGLRWSTLRPEVSQRVGALGYPNIYGLWAHGAYMRLLGLWFMGLYNIQVSLT